MRFDAFDRGTALLMQNADHPQVQRLYRFADGFVSLRQDSNGHLWISDWRMGQYPNFFFAFNIGPPLSAGQTPPVASQERRTMAVGAGLVWLGTRMRGTDVDPPRGP
jgi:inner membrane protein